MHIRLHRRTELIATSRKSLSNRCRSGERRRSPPATGGSRRRPRADDRPCRRRIPRHFRTDETPPTVGLDPRHVDPARTGNSEYDVGMARNGIRDAPGRAIGAFDHQNRTGRATRWHRTELPSLCRGAASAPSWESCRRNAPATTRQTTQDHTRGSLVNGHWPTLPPGTSGERPDSGAGVTNVMASYS